MREGDKRDKEREIRKEDEGNERRKTEKDDDGMEDEGRRIGVYGGRRR
jgi:hypothetical protein